MTQSIPTAAQLIGISYSPWTEKARWALDHHRKPYRYREHLILFGMPELRLRTGKWTGPLTVPALIEEGPQGSKEVIGDSWDIARHADRQGEGARLFPESEFAQIEKYNRLSEEALDAVRILFSARLMKDPEAKAEALPSFVPRPLRRPLAGIASVGVAYIAHEFGYSVQDVERALAELRDIYSELSRDLQAAGGDYLVGGRFSYADIAMATTIQGLEPSKDAPVRFGEALRRCWGAAELQEEFKGLLEWRDRLYTRHRGTSAQLD
jgi:glutathione S-transferase